jgi:molybdenum cofactor synthesis domain-containing protein
MQKVRPFRSLISVDEAMKLMLGAASPVGRTEKVSITDAYGRVLAKDVTAALDVPPFDRSAMDGYAVRAGDTYGATLQCPRTLRIKGAVYAGDAPGISIGIGECAQIATGAVVPKGADAVVMAEDTDASQDKVRIHKPVHPGANVSVRGSDIAKGKKVVSKGTALSPSKIGVLSSLGISEVEVYQKPEVAIIPTGSEIAEVGSALREGQVYNSNSFTLASVVSENGAVPQRMQIVEDKVEKLEGALGNALKTCNIALFSGGSSVGERDLLADIIKKRGQILFHGVQIKPGKPFLCGVVDKKVVLGIPGYPAACTIIGYVFVVPLVRKIARLGDKIERAVKAKMAQKWATTLGRKQFLTVRLKGGEAFPVFKESGAITSMSEADGYIEIPENVDLIDKGEEVEVTLF